MIFKKLTLNNFRVFHGEHTLDLKPRKTGLLCPPVILFGGLNGAGKTTILTAIRLVFLGNRATGRAPGNSDYKVWLKEQINNKALDENSNVTAQVILEFSHTHEGKHNSYILERSWNAKGCETLSITLNDHLLDVLTGEQVQTILSEMVPPGIGDLFFFDGEKIAELAEDDTGEYLKEAVQKLLGIDIVNRLSVDLDIYIKQITKDTADKSFAKKINLLEEEKAQFYGKAIMARKNADLLVPELSTLQTKISNLEAKIQHMGGAWATTKAQEKEKVDELLKEEILLQRDIQHELEGDYPISLAPTAVKDLIEQLERDKDTKEFQVFNSKFNEYSKLLASKLAEMMSTEQGQIASILEMAVDDISTSENYADIELDISDSDFYSLKEQIRNSEESALKVRKLGRSLDLNKNELVSLSSNIERAPDQEELVEIYQHLRSLDSEKSNVKHKYVEFLSDAKANMVKAVELAKRLEKLFSQQKNEETQDKAVVRVNNAKNMLAKFSEELTLLRVKQLEELFGQAYRKLARKGDLKLSTKINPATFDVILLDREGLAINRKSLSAGEKQIFAFAILEALAKLSGKVLPVVVDTPLGRLDSMHRDKLINHYFPQASEQVILLSTDTEVDNDFYNLLTTHLSHSFQIDFNEQTRCSNVKEGYFELGSQKEAV